MTCKHGVAAPPFCECAICFFDEVKKDPGSYKDMSGCHVPLNKTPENVYEDRIGELEMEIKRLKEQLERFKYVVRSLLEV